MKLPAKIKGWLNIDTTPERLLTLYATTSDKKYLSQLVAQFNLSLYHYLFSLSTKEMAEDVSFSGNLNDLVLIAGRKEDPDTLFFQRRLSIEGDTELGLEVKNLMDSVDLDLLPTPLKTLLNQIEKLIYFHLHLQYLLMVE